MNIDEEVQRAYREGVEREENLPFLMEPSCPNRAGVLLVHGFTASPWEMRQVGKYLTRQGFLSFGVRLPGHGTTAEDLAGRRWEEWRDEVERAYCRLAAAGPVYGVGMSSGALLLLLLAERRPMAGLVLLSPYLRLRHRLAPAAPLLRLVHPFQHHPLPPFLAPFYYDRRPLSGVWQLQRLLRRLRPALPRITTPVLVASALGDGTVPIDSARELFARLGSRRREYHLYGPEVPHVLTTCENPYLAATLQLIGAFLKNLHSRGGTSG